MDFAEALALFSTFSPSAAGRAFAPVLIDTLEALSDAVSSHIHHSRVLAIDLEHSARSFLGHVCTLQISCSSQPECVFVIDTCKDDVKRALPSLLGPPLSNPATLKLFFAANNDIIWLKSLELSVTGLLDTALLVSAVSKGRPAQGLGEVMQHFLGFSHPEKKRMQLADWRIRPLPRELLEYAASDAFFLFPLTLALIAKCDADAWNSATFLSTALLASCASKTAHAPKVNYADLLTFGLRSLPLLPHQAARDAAQKFSLVSVPLTEPELRTLSLFLRMSGWRFDASRERDTCAEDIVPRAVLFTSCHSMLTSAPLPASLSEDVLSELEQIAEEEAAMPLAAILAPLEALSLSLSPSSQNIIQRDEKKRARARLVFQRRKTPLYSNCELLAPDNTVLARIDKSRALFYLEVGAAVAVPPEGESVVDLSSALLGAESGKVLRVRMLREPRGMGHAGDAFHLSVRRNECAVCGCPWGDGEGLLRLFIIPRGLRALLPLCAKSYSNHDVVLSCAPCHRRADIAIAALLSRLARELQVAAPSAPPLTADSESLRALAHATKKYASALLNPRLPEERALEILPKLLDAMHAVLAVAEAASGDERRAASFEGKLEALVALAAPELQARALAAGLTAQLVCKLARVEPFALARAAAQKDDADADEVEAGEQSLFHSVMLSVYEGGDSWQKARVNFGEAIEGEDEQARVGISGLTLACEARVSLFIRRWRRHFLDTLKPSALPGGWDVNRAVFVSGTRTQGKSEPSLVAAFQKNSSQ
jgi:ribonuclease D